ncbi:probable E3 ubiquitin-protein ligase RNF144A-A [Lingula anatina]|uniref:E3 ubiquitin-protein ligase RNF144B n=1 Tax=Lingula anatina TaxID=7574 RepID=A0A1S3IZZ5_LINAN|nr:probable E3 ubiquitin-protein ligase RNF144A-A [Lingula anatina]|eukprot:XP_013403772.1 probable E3 ubiquitin-protein ligase RNF144A-A [Lingula anatina]
MESKVKPVQMMASSETSESQEKDTKEQAESSLSNKDDKNMVTVSVFTPMGAHVFYSPGTHNTMDMAIEPLVTCRLCLMELPAREMYEMQDCQCLYCQMCVIQYLTVMISDGNVLVITCPDARCRQGGKFLPSEIEQLVDTMTFKRYQRLKFSKEVDLDPSRMWCPEIGCETVCHVCPLSDKKNVQGIPVKCPKCYLEFCSICKSNWHADEPCDAYNSKVKGHDAGIPISSEEESKIKRCPMCHIPIERADGCAQMMCRQCKHVFCWYCLQSLQDDFLLRHYDKGPCKNKLGHSRASVMWHRTQVVGIFAGFGLLLLIASPFLLLAAPCLLCCKCNACKACAEEEDV